MYTGCFKHWINPKTKIKLVRASDSDMKYNKIRRILIAISTVIFLIIADMVLVGVIRDHTRMTNPVQARKAGERIPISTVGVKTGDFQAIMGAECISKENSRVVLSSTAGTKVMKINVASGDSVAKDELLIALDDTTLSDTLDNFLAGHEIADKHATFMNSFIGDLRKLKKDNLISIVDLIRASEDAAQARRAVTQLRKEIINSNHLIEQTRISSPIDGVVSAVHVGTGSTPRPYQDLIVIDSIDPLEFECTFAEDTFNNIEDHGSAEISFASAPAQRLSANFDRILSGEILPRDIDNNFTVQAVFKMPNPEHTYLPGMHAIIRLGKTIDGLVIPSISLINQRGDKADIFVVNEDSKTELRTISIGRYASGYVEVLEGLSIGDRVVVAGQLHLQNGDIVVDDTGIIETDEEDTATDQLQEINR